jgi:hypothetical protein
MEQNLEGLMHDVPDMPLEEIPDVISVIPWESRPLLVVFSAE